MDALQMEGGEGAFSKRNPKCLNKNHLKISTISIGLDEITRYNFRTFKRFGFFSLLPIRFGMLAAIESVSFYIESHKLSKLLPLTLCV